MLILCCLLFELLLYLTLQKLQLPKNFKLGMNVVNDAIIYDNPYFYEMASFLYSGTYITAGNRMKYTYRVLDLRENLVSNDVHGKFSNNLKTIFERNTHLYHFVRKALAFKPLNAFGIIRRSFNDVFVKQREVNYISGKNTPLRVFNIDIDKINHSYHERSIYSNIIPFTKDLFYICFVFIKDIINDLIKLIYKFRKGDKIKIRILGFEIILKKKARNKNKKKNRTIFFLIKLPLIKKLKILKHVIFKKIRRKINFIKFITQCFFNQRMFST